MTGLWLKRVVVAGLLATAATALAQSNYGASDGGTGGSGAGGGYDASLDMEGTGGSGTGGTGGWATDSGTGGSGSYDRDAGTGGAGDAGTRF